MKSFDDTGNIDPPAHGVSPRHGLISYGSASCNDLAELGDTEHNPLSWRMDAETPVLSNGQSHDTGHNLVRITENVGRRCYDRMRSSVRAPWP